METVAAKPVSKSRKAAGKSTSAKSSQTKTKPATSTNATKKAVATTKSASSAPAKPVPLARKTTKPKLTPAEAIAQRLLERQEEKEDRKLNPPKRRGRRGRRPKNMTDYTPSHGEEVDDDSDSDNQRLRYDTGISMHRGEDDVFSLEFDDYEKELNFDS